MCQSHHLFAGLLRRSCLQVLRVPCPAIIMHHLVVRITAAVLPLVVELEVHGSVALRRYGSLQRLVGLVQMRNGALRCSAVCVR